MSAIKKTAGNMAEAAVVLTLISFALKGMGMLFRVYLSDRMGSGGLGLYQLVMSVYSVFATFATSGFTVSVSRLAAERLCGKDGRSGAARVLLAASALALFMGGVAAAVLFFGADYLAPAMVGDTRTALPLKILALALPFMALSACLKGYFTALGQVYKPSAASLFEQAAKIFITVYTFETVCRGESSAAVLCRGVVAGLTAGECFSYAFLFLLYLLFSGKKRDGAVAEPFFRTVRGVGSVTLPIAASAYVTNILHSVESVLIPSRFVLYGGDREKALSDFGAIRGMSIPLLFFPYGFLGALLSVQVPQVSRLNVAEDKGERNRLIGQIMETTIGFSLVSGGFFLLFPRELSLAVYGSAECAESVRMLAWVTPFMYIETMSDGLLKTIGEQKRTLIYSVINSAFRIAAIVVFIPHSGATGYLWLLVVSNTLSFLLCFGRLRRVTGLSFGKRLYFSVAASALGLCAAYGVSRLGVFSAPLGNCVLAAAVCAAVYLLCLKRRPSC